MGFKVLLLLVVLARVSAVVRGPIHQSLTLKSQVNNANDVAATPAAPAVPKVPKAQLVANPAVAAKIAQIQSGNQCTFHACTCCEIL